VSKKPTKRPPRRAGAHKGDVLGLTPRRLKRTAYTSPEGFDVNERGVCLNPDKYVVHDSKYQHLIVYLAQVNSDWWYGSDCRADWSSCCRMGGPCSAVKKMYAGERRFARTKDEALRTAVAMCLTWFKESERVINRPSIAREHAHKIAEDAAKHCPPQLKLF